MLPTLKWWYIGTVTIPTLCYKFPWHDCCFEIRLKLIVCGVDKSDLVLRP